GPRATVRRTEEYHLRSRGRVTQGEFVRMEAQPRRWGAAVKGVTKDRKIVFGGMDADLVSFTGYRRRLEEGQPMGGGDDSEARLGASGTCMERPAQVFLAASDQGRNSSELRSP